MEPQSNLRYDEKIAFISSLLDFVQYETEDEVRSPLCHQLDSIKEFAETLGITITFSLFLDLEKYRSKNREDQLNVLTSAWEKDKELFLNAHHSVIRDTEEVSYEEEQRIELVSRELEVNSYSQQYQTHKELISTNERRREEQQRKLQQKLEKAKAAEVREAKDRSCCKNEEQNDLNFERNTNEVEYVEPVLIAAIIDSLTNEQKLVVIASLMIIAKTSGELTIEQKMLIDHFGKRLGVNTIPSWGEKFGEIFRAGEDRLLRMLSTLTNPQKDWFLTTLDSVLKCKEGPTDVEQRWINTILAVFEYSAEQYQGAIQTFRALEMFSTLTNDRSAVH